MDYTLDGVFTPGKIGAWRFDKRSYASGPPPRKLGEPPKGMTNELVSPAVCMHAVRQARRVASDCWLLHTAVLQCHLRGLGLIHDLVPWPVVLQRPEQPRPGCWRAACRGLARTADLCRLRAQTRHLIHAINEATEAIPGWDEYVATGRATQLWDGTLPAKPR